MALLWSNDEPTNQLISETQISETQISETQTQNPNSIIYAPNHTYYNPNLDSTGEYKIAMIEFLNVVKAQAPSYIFNENPTRGNNRGKVNRKSLNDLFSPEFILSQIGKVTLNDELSSNLNLMKGVMASVYDVTMWALSKTHDWHHEDIINENKRKARISFTTNDTVLTSIDLQIEAKKSEIQKLKIEMEQLKINRRMYLLSKLTAKA
jgi:hypothetical protein